MIQISESRPVHHYVGPDIARAVFDFRFLQFITYDSIKCALFIRTVSHRTDNTQNATWPKCCILFSRESLNVPPTLKIPSQPTPLTTSTMGHWPIDFLQNVPTSLTRCIIILSGTQIMCNSCFTGYGVTLLRININFV